jgi:hypothetical protein
MRGPAVLLDIAGDQLTDVSIVFGNENVHRANGTVPRCDRDAAREARWVREVW